MDLTHIDQALKDTLDDRRLSRSERKAITQILADLEGDEDALRYVRNRAFEMAKAETDTQTGAMAIDWLEGVIRAIDGQRQTEKAAPANAYFSPGDACRNQVTGLCRAATQSIDVCVYTITDNRIKDALLAAHEQGVRVRIITDDEKVDDRGSDVYDLADAGIEVTVDRGPEFMHHKFALFDRKALLTGSFNWTRGASEANSENIIVTEDARLVDQFMRKFEELWQGLPRLG